MKITDKTVQCVTQIEQPPTIVFSEDMIKAFKRATRDTNDIHPPVVMGFQEDAAAEMFARESLKNPDLVYAGQDMRFKDYIFNDEKIHPHLNEADGAIEVVLHKEDEISAAVGKIYFSSPEALGQETAQPSGIEYIIEEQDIEDFHRGLGSERHSMNPLFAIALASSSLIKYFQENQIKIPDDKMPVYASHRIRVYSPITQIDYGDRIFLSVDECTPEKYNPKRPLFKADLSATTMDGRRLYTVTVLLGVDDRSRLISQH